MRPVSGKQVSEDVPIDLALRPKHLSEFVGQQEVKENLNIAITAAQKRGDPLDHFLFCAPAGLVKTTLADIIAVEM